VSRPGAATWRALGTTATVVVTDQDALIAARSAVESELEALDAACSRFRGDSELSLLNSSGGRGVRAGTLLLEAVGVALRAARLTDGLVDPTVGEALVLAGYDRDFEQLAAAPGGLVWRRVPGWQRVRVDSGRGELRVPRGVVLDLGATAKALGADRAAAAAGAAAPGVGLLVNLGGDISTSGPPPAGGWTIRVADDHRAPADAPGQTIAVGSGAVATSSTTVRRWGEGRHHIIDPRTGVPAASGWRTVSVAAATCVDANVASTAAIVLDRRAMDWLNERNLPARLVDQTGRVSTTAGWPSEAVAA
jgi:thiamine biosynthesis lipoprotein